VLPGRAGGAGGSVERGALDAVHDEHFDGAVFPLQSEPELFAERLQERQAGLIGGDIVTVIDGHAVTSHEQFSQIMSQPNGSNSSPG